MSLLSSRSVLYSLYTINSKRTWNVTNFFCVRSIHSHEKSPLFKLRQKTGLAYNLCREALDKHNNCIEEAEAWLKAQELAHGLQKATKLRGRSAREGLIGLAVHRGNKVASMLELNCETDFVARNQTFKDFALELTEEFASMWGGSPLMQSRQIVIEELKPSELQLKILDDRIVPLITKLGENIKVCRAYHYRVRQENQKLFGQIHALAGRKDGDNAMIRAGRFGSIVALNDLSPNLDNLNSDLFEAAGNRLCQHIIGYNPTYIELPENIKEHLLAAEKERAASVVEEDKNEDDSDSEFSPTPRNNRDEWPSMMDQNLILSDEETVRDFCEKNRLSIVYFNRFECGESSQ